MATKKTAGKGRNNSEAAGDKEQPEIRQKGTTALVSGHGMSKEQLLALVEADEGRGQENMTAQDFAIPRISLLQSGSPQVKKSEGKYVKGAEEGDFFDNVTNTIYAKGETGFLFIPVSYRRANIEWIPKDDGGGFVADHGPDDSIFRQCVKDKKNRMMLKNGHEVVATAEFFIIAINRETFVPRNAVISLAKSQLEASRKMNTMINELLVPRTSGSGKFNPAMYYSIFDATSIPRNKNDFNWMGWNIVRQGDTLAFQGGENLYLQARHFREAVVKGDVEVSKPVDDGTAGGAAGSPDDDKAL